MEEKRIAQYTKIIISKKQQLAGLVEDLENCLKTQGYERALTIDRLIGGHKRHERIYAHEKGTVIINTLDLPENNPYGDTGINQIVKVQESDRYQNGFIIYASIEKKWLEETDLVLSDKLKQLGADLVPEEFIAACNPPV